MNPIIYIAIAAILFVAACVIFVLGTKAKGTADEARALADLEAKKVLETARLQAEAEVRKAQASAQKAELDAKEQLLKAREAVDEEVARRRNELAELEKRLLGKEESLDRTIGTAEKREQDAEHRS